MNFLKERQGQLDGVVICGGEPTINPDLPELIKEIKDMGFLVKLDTNGTNPAMLKSLIESNLIDYAAMDIKGPKEKYCQIAGSNIDINLIQESIDILKNSELDFEFRTTVVPNFIDQQDIKNMAQWISQDKPGQLKYYLQNFFPNKTLDPEFEKLHPYSLSDLKQVQQEISPLFKHCGLRGQLILFDKYAFVVYFYILKNNMNIEFPVFKTKTDGVTKTFDMSDPVSRREYFNAKCGDEIIKIKEFFDNGNTFVAYFLGKKNSGKGTYCKLFSEIVGPDRVVHLSVGDLVRNANEAAKDPAQLAEIKKFMEENYRGFMSIDECINALMSRDVGSLLPTEFILALTKMEIAKHPRKAIFLDGFPRQMDQVTYSLYFRDLINYRQDPDFFVMIDIPNTIIDARIKSRVICPICHTPRNTILLRTKEIGYDKDNNNYYLICDNPGCEGFGKEKMVGKEGDDKGIEAIKDRLATDETLIEKAFGIYGIPKILLRNSVPVDVAKDMVDDYELTPEFVYSYNQAENKVDVTEKPWTVKDDKGTESFSLMPPPVVVSMIKQMAKTLGL